MPKTVTVNWDALDRANPVTMVVTDERTASLEYMRATSPIAGEDAADRLDRAREQIALWAQEGGEEALPVVLYDVSKEEPTLMMLVCTSGADFVKDIGVTSEERATAERKFREWVAARPAKPSKKRAPVKEPAPVTAPTVRPVVSAQDVETPPAPPAPVGPEEPKAAHVEVGSQFEDMERLLDRGKRSEDARLGWRGLLNSRWGMHLPPDGTEKEMRDNLTTIARGWTGHKVVAVANDKGGANKTPTALMLSAAMARHIALLVAMFDNNESAGIAKDRVDVEGRHVYTAKHLAQYAKGNPHMPQSKMVEFVHRHAEDRYHLIASHHPSLVDPSMTREEVAEVYRTLAKFYSLTITDSGNTLVADNWLTMIQHTDQLVVPLVTSSDRYERARSMLATLDNFGGQYSDLARNAVVAVSIWRPEDRKVAQEYVDLFTGKVREVVVIPYDQHLGSHDLRWESLSPATQAAFIRLAAAVARGLQGVDEA